MILGATIASLWGTPAEAQERTPVYSKEQATAGRILYAETSARPTAQI